MGVLLHKASLRLASHAACAWFPLGLLQDPVLQPPAPSLSMCEAEAVKSTTTAIGQASETATLAPALPPLDFRRTQLKLCTVLGSAHAFLRGTERAAASHAEAHDEASAIMVEALKCLGIVLVTHASHDAAGFLVNKDVQSLLTDMLLCNPVTSVRDQTFQLLQNLTQLGQVRQLPATSVHGHPRNAAKPYLNFSAKTPT
jgi:hypothetical protein